MRLELICSGLTELLVDNNYSQTTINFYKREWKKLNDFLVITSLIVPSSSGLLHGRKRSKEYLKRLVIWSVKVIKAAKKSMIIPKPFQPTFF